MNARLTLGEKLKDLRNNREGGKLILTEVPENDEMMASPNSR